MTYTPNSTWIRTTPITSAKLSNLETQYTESSTYLAGHIHDTLYYTQTQCQAAYWNSTNDGTSSGADADLLYKATGNLHGSSFQGLGVDTGIIIWWYGASNAVPSGWHLCDGTTGTPDLRGKFVVGAGNTYNPGTAGGSATFTATGTITVDAHVLTIAEMGPHRHPFLDTICASSAYKSAAPSAAYTMASPAAYGGTTSSAGSASGHGHSGAEGTAMTGNAIASLPRYYSLCYIQKTA
jgi:hypothetical protein